MKKGFLLLVAAFLLIVIGVGLSYLSRIHKSVISGTELWNIKIGSEREFIVEGQTEADFVFRARSEDMFYVRSQGQMKIGEEKCFEDKEQCYFETWFSVAKGEKCEVYNSMEGAVGLEIESGEVSRIVVSKTAEGIAKSNILIGIALLAAFVGFGLILTRS